MGCDVIDPEGGLFCPPRAPMKRPRTDIVESKRVNAQTS